MILLLTFRQLSNSLRVYLLVNKYYISIITSWKTEIDVYVCVCVIVMSYGGFGIWHSKYSNLIPIVFLSITINTSIFVNSFYVQVYKDKNFLSAK